MPAVTKREKSQKSSGKKPIGHSNRNSIALPLVKYVKGGIVAFVLLLTSVTFAMILLRSNPNVSDKDGWTAMWTAARCGYAEIVRLLAETEAVLDSVCTESGLTPLHAAS